MISRLDITPDERLAYTGARHDFIRELEQDIFLVWHEDEVTQVYGVPVSYEMDEDGDAFVTGHRFYPLVVGC